MQWRLDIWIASYGAFGKPLEPGRVCLRARKVGRRKLHSCNTRHIIDALGGFLLGPPACVLCSAIGVLGWVKRQFVARPPPCCQEGRRLVTSCG